MDNKRKELVEMLEYYTGARVTHENRFLLLVRKHTELFGEWVNLIKTTPANTEDFAVRVNTLWEKSKNIADELAEVTQNMADDTDILVSFFSEATKKYGNKDEQS